MSKLGYVYSIFDYQNNRIRIGQSSGLNLNRLKTQLSYLGRNFLLFQLTFSTDFKEHEKRVFFDLASIERDADWFDLSDSNDKNVFNRKSKLDHKKLIQVAESLTKPIDDEDLVLSVIPTPSFYLSFQIDWLTPKYRMIEIEPESISDYGLEFELKHLKVSQKEESIQVEVEGFPSKLSVNHSLYSCQ